MEPWYTQGMASGSYFRDLEAKYIAAALDDADGDQEVHPVPVAQPSVWSSYAEVTSPAVVYAIGEREDIVIDEELLNGYLLDDPFSAPLEPEFQAEVITSVIQTIGHPPIENAVVDALSEAFVT